MNVLINSNTFDYAGTQRAILVQAGQDGNGTNNVTITGNNIDIKLDGAGNAVTGFLELQSQALPGPANTSSMCADIGGAGAAANTFTHSQNVGAIAGGDIRVRQRFDGTLRLPGYAGAANSCQVVTLPQRAQQRSNRLRPRLTIQRGFAGGAACTQPRSGLNNTSNIYPARSVCSRFRTSETGCQHRSWPKCFAV